MSSFRASPWVSYEPPTTTHTNRQPPSQVTMDEDVDMDAPQISTLREEETPPPQPLKKLTIHPKKRPAPPPAPVEPWTGTTEKATDELDDEEDQLIDELIDDDDDDELAKPSPSSQPGRSSETAQKRKSLVKKKSRKSDKRVGEVEKKVKEKVSQPTGAHLAPTMSCFKANLAESHEDIEIINSSPTSHAGESSVPKSKKKVSPRKPPTIPRAKAKLAKQKSAIPSFVLEDAGVLSESYAGTAASSPVTAQLEQNTPEPENIPPSSPPLTSVPLAEEPNLENVPLPIYPLPTKPFPVQPPPKIPSGFAPLLPLDKNNKKVRHWRPAKREIRGIAGGRWLARTWVGDKESDFATHAAIANQAKPADEKSNSVSLPKLSSVSISAPASLKSLGKLKASSKPGSNVTSANPSRAPSAIPENQGTSVTSAVRAPTKMRILQLAPSSEGGDSEMMTPVQDL